MHGQDEINDRSTNLKNLKQGRIFMGDLDFKRLFTPQRLGKLELPNRIIMSPMVTLFATSDGRVSEKMIRYYAERARGGVGLIVVEATYPCLYRTPGRLYIYDDGFIPGLKRLTKAVHEQGSKVAVQLNPSRGREDHENPVSASDVPSPGGGPRPRPLTKEEIERIISDFGEGLLRAQAAGFDAVEIHGASGYLVGQFLSPLSNRRQDQYGGSLENRARLAIRLLQAARERLGLDFPILYKLCVEEHLPGGFGLQEARVVARWLEESGADAIDVTTGVYGSLYYTVPPLGMVPACNADFARAVKTEVRIPVCVSGKISNPFLAEEILSQGKSDFILLGRSLLADPLWPAKAREGLEEKIRKCIACNRCLENVIHNQRPLECSVNAEVGREGESAGPAAKVKKILVVGGGPGGMQAAIDSALRGHRVILWEKKAVLGGNLIAAATPSFKRGIAEFTRYLSDSLSRSGAEVHLNRMGNGESILAEKPDLVIMATGSSPWLPSLPGIESSRVTNAVSVLEGSFQVGDRVVVVGGGMVGCEVTALLRERGIGVQLVTRRGADQLGSDMEPIYRLWFFKLLWPGLGVEVLSQCRCQAVVEQGILVEQNQAVRLIEGDTVVFAWGMASNTEILNALREKGFPVVAVGDCLEPRNIYDAIHEGTWALSDRDG